MKTISIGAIALLLLAAQDRVSTLHLPQDDGPKTIDVSSYPASQQLSYKLFLTKCNKCHTVARGINTTMTRSEWELYVKRMILKTGSDIDGDQGKMLFDFLAYDQKARKDKFPGLFYSSIGDAEVNKLKKLKRDAQ